MKEDHVSLVIFQAKEAISKACEGRACLPECLRAIERTALAEVDNSPLCESGAKAAKRTAAATARPHGARLRVPVGGVRSACSAFAFFFRRARCPLRLIRRALCARLPGIARLVKMAIASVAITLGVTCPLLRADVVCTWNGTEYTCSGEGSSVRVVGGGSGGGDSVVTNIVGVCTNCVAMSPEYVANWKAEAVRIVGTDGDYDGLLERVRNTVTYSQVIQSYLAAYTNECEVSQWRGYPGTAYTAPRSSITNFMHGVGAFQSDKPKNNAASLTRGVYSAPDNLNAALCLQFVACYDGAAMAYNKVAESARSSVYTAHAIETEATAIQSGLRTLRTMVDGLSDEECTAQYVPGDGTGGEGSGGGGSLTNQVSSNWCTYDQGEAIKELLSDIEKWDKDQVSYLQSVSNYLFSVDASIKSAFFSRYTHIPSESNMGVTWQDVYLAGQPTQWGYEPTNILQRIELLIYGISGVGTNSTDVTDATGIDPSQADSAGDDVRSALEDMSLDDSDVSRDFGTISQALERFYNRFSSIAGTQFSGQQLTASYSVEIGESRFDVPSFQLDSEHSRIANTAQLMCRSFLVILYLLAAAYAGFRFYAVFLAFVVKYAKWAQELLSSLFAD